MDYFYNNGFFDRDGFAGQRVKFFDFAQFLGFLFVEVAFDPLEEAFFRAPAQIGWAVGPPAARCPFSATRFHFHAPVTQIGDRKMEGGNQLSGLRSPLKVAGWVKRSETQLILARITSYPGHPLANLAGSPAALIVIVHIDRRRTFIENLWGKAPFERKSVGAPRALIDPPLFDNFQ